MKELNLKDTKTVAGGAGHNNQECGKEARELAKKTAEDVLKGLNYANDKLMEGLTSLSEKIDKMRCEAE